MRRRRKASRITARSFTYSAYFTYFLPHAF